MINVEKKSSCTGCTACANVCPKQCITMTEDQEGFDYPIVDLNRCINCHLCERICPVHNPLPLSSQTYTICAQNKNESIRARSSVGGIIGAIYQSVFEKDGIVFGVGFDESNMARFLSAENMEDCFERKIFASKYVSAYVGDIFCRVKSELQSGRLVCFVGLPCQVAGLVSYLSKSYNNLWLIDLTCYGVPSRKLYKRYLEFIENKYKKRIVDVRFRDKTFGYAAPTMCIELESGIVKSQNSAVKSYLRTFFNNLSARPSCFECPYKTVERVSDLTVGDMRSIHKFIPNMDDDLGTTVVYVHTNQGETILENISDASKTEKIPIDNVLETSGKKMVSCPEMNPQRENFYSDIDNLSYITLVNKYCPPEPSEFVAIVTKGFLKVIGLQNSGLLKRLKRR